MSEIKHTIHAKFNYFLLESKSYYKIVLLYTAKNLPSYDENNLAIP